MGSEDFRIIPHQVAESVHPSDPDLFRYIIAYASPGQPLFIASGPNDQLMLVRDEKLALRFPTIEDAELQLAIAKNSMVTMLSGLDQA